LSDREGFLTRWSRRKREAEQAAPEPPPAPPEPSVPAPAAATPVQTHDTAEAKEPEAPAVDLSSLPPLESITAGTDIRAFLAPGIPAQLARAALRRAWAADPAIRDFVGLAENAWDFNAADAVPGFGPVTPAQGGRRLLAEALRDEEAGSPSSAVETSEPLQKPDVSAPLENRSAQGLGEEAPSPDQAAATVAEAKDRGAAVQDKEADDRPTRTARQHGRALPR
jgi:Protein of unknown function (DUF3306)